MSETEYNAWWPLHIRAAKGETLTEAEQAVYEVGLKQMYAEEELDYGIEQMRRMRLRIAEADSEQQSLLVRHAQVKTQIAELEANLDDKANLLRINKLPYCC